MLHGVSHGMPVGFGASSGAKPSWDAHLTDHWGVLTPWDPGALSPCPACARLTCEHVGLRDVLGESVPPANFGCWG